MGERHRRLNPLLSILAAKPGGAPRLSAPQMCAQHPQLPRGDGEMGSGPRQRRGSAVLPACGGCRGRCTSLSQRKHFGKASLAGQAAQRAESSSCKVPSSLSSSPWPLGGPGPASARAGEGERGCVSAALVPQASAQSERQPIANQLLISAVSDAGMAAHGPRGVDKQRAAFPCPFSGSAAGASLDKRRARSTEKNTALPFSQANRAVPG